MAEKARAVEGWGLANPRADGPRGRRQWRDRLLPGQCGARRGVERGVRVRPRYQAMVFPVEAVAVWMRKALR
ncbi:hypothetical protein [Leifsonia xyli]|uniref:hypothetical protein n=1 Tax=Leifsonia xyli TaxID=1575 RepID=UPI00114D1286|nr:hypothetical protein [Leifsonia xyli]